MPWHLSSSQADCKGKVAVVKDSDGKTVGRHPTRKRALAQLAALNISEQRRTGRKA